LILAVYCEIEEELIHHSRRIHQGLAAPCLSLTSYTEGWSHCNTSWAPGTAPAYAAKHRSRTYPHLRETDFDTNARLIHPSDPTSTMQTPDGAHALEVKVI
jgi:hypothetical protein|tara:strand:+ start:5846 stop:6148 length:303 start_codon:yes stop_codon:yes gene_type:complete